MKSRREFLKNAATGAVLLSSGAAEVLGLAETRGQAEEQDKSKVVIARDSQLHASDGKLDEKRVAALLDRAIASYTGHNQTVAAWKQIVARSHAQERVIGLKTNGLGGRGISTHAALVTAIVERL